MFAWQLPEEKLFQFDHRYKFLYYSHAMIICRVNNAYHAWHDASRLFRVYDMVPMQPACFSSRNPMFVGFGYLSISTIITECL